MATVVEVEQSKPKVESFTIKLAPHEARDIHIYMKQYYQKSGYGTGYEKTVGLYKVIQDGLDGKKTPEYVF